MSCIGVLQQVKVRHLSDVNTMEAPFLQANSTQQPSCARSCRLTSAYLDVIRVGNTAVMRQWLVKVSSTTRFSNKAIKSFMVSHSIK